MPQRVASRRCRETDSLRSGGDRAKAGGENACEQVPPGTAEIDAGDANLAFAPGETANHAMPRAAS